MAERSAQVAADDTRRPMRPLDVDRAAWFLIRRYGESRLAVAVASRRIAFCVDSGAESAAYEWCGVLRKIIELEAERGERSVH